MGGSGVVHPATAASPPTSSNATSWKPPGMITTTDNTLTVRLDRRAYSPVLRKADLPNDTTVPWWDTAPCATNSPDPLPRTSCAEIRAKHKAMCDACFPRLSWCPATGLRR